MPDNDFLKPSFHNPTVTGRYLVFAFCKGFQPGIVENLVDGYETLAQIEADFRLDPTSQRPLKTVSRFGTIEDGYDYLEVFDMEEKRFIDINDLHFQAV